MPFMKSSIKKKKELNIFYYYIKEFCYVKSFIQRVCKIVFACFKASTYDSEILWFIWCWII